MFGLCPKLPYHFLASQNFGWAFACPQVGQLWLKKWTRVDSGALVCQKVGHYPNKDQFFGLEQTIGRVQTIRLNYHVCECLMTAYYRFRFKRFSFSNGCDAFRFLTAGLRVDPCHMPTFIIHLRIVNYLRRTFLATLWQRAWTKHANGSLLPSEFAVICYRVLTSDK